MIYVPLTTQNRQSKYEVLLPKLSFLHEVSVANVQGIASIPRVAWNESWVACLNPSWTKSGKLSVSHSICKFHRSAAKTKKESRIRQYPFSLATATVKTCPGTLARGVASSPCLGDTTNHEKGTGNGWTAIPLVPAISRHGDRPLLGAAVVTVSPIASLIRTF